MFYTLFIGFGVTAALTFWSQLNTDANYLGQSVENICYNSLSLPICGPNYS